MTCTLIGFKTLDFVDDKGNNIKGINIYIAYPDNTVIGNMCEKKFIADAVLQNCDLKTDDLPELVGCALGVEFGRHDKILNLYLPE